MRTMHLVDRAMKVHNKEEVEKKIVGDGEAVQELEQVEEVDEEDEEEDKNDDKCNLHKEYIPVYYIPGTRATVSTTKSLLRKIQIIYDDAAYRMNEDLLESLQIESKGQLRIDIKQLHKLIPMTMQEIKDKRKAIYEAEERYAWKKHFIIQKLLRESEKIGIHYNKPQGANLRTNSIYHLHSILGLEEIELQEKVSQEENVIKETQIILKNDLKLTNNLP